MTAISQARGPLLLAEFSTQINEHDQDPGSGVDDNVITNIDDITNMDVDWSAFEQLPGDTTEPQYHTLTLPHDHSAEHERQHVEATTPPPPTTTRDGESSTDKLEPPQGFNDGDFETPRRELRPQQREKRTFTTTWIDNDETGDYDPVEEERKARQKRAKLRAATQQRLHRDCAETAFDDEVSDRLTDDLTDEILEPAKLVVPLAFTSQTGRLAFTELLSQLALQDHSDKAGYRTFHGPTQEASNGISTEIDLTAKPFARGCWGCTTAGNCSLLHDERQWPCQACSHVDLDCEPIMPPIRKRACGVCKRRNVSCSYTYTRRHGTSCEQCERVGQRCVAGPVEESIRPRISYDRDWKTDPLPKRRAGKQKELEDCLECVGARRSCSCPAGCPGSPCEECVNRGLPCTITSNAPTESASSGENAAPADNATSARSKVVNDKITESIDPLSLTKPHTVEQVSLPSHGPAAEHQLQRPRGTLRKIYTSFSHPIVFNCDLEGDNDPSCHFCTEPALPQLGFGLVRPEVIDWSDGRGFVEIKGGHMEVNQIEKTRLCYSCTSSRLAIVTCYRHRMRRITTQGPGRRNDDEAQPCHVCDGQAAYECSPSDEDTARCGLKLCRPCALTLVQHHGYLGEMLGRLTDRPEDPAHRTWRADGEFLKEDGHISRYLTSLDT